MTPLRVYRATRNMEPETRNARPSALSRLALGTVQFGLPYGVANRSGQPPFKVARDILACAIEVGVTVLETAEGYGESEAVLGRALADLTSILVGVESADQMRENLALFAKGPLPPDLMQAVVATVPSLSDAILDPWRWAQRMPDAKLKT